MSGSLDDDNLPTVWVGAGQVTGICHLLVHDIAFRTLDKSVAENLSDILTDEMGDHVTVRFTEEWRCAVIHVRMEDDIKKIKSFVEDKVSMKGRILNVCDMNKIYAAEIPAVLAAPGTITQRRPRQRQKDS